MFLYLEFRSSKHLPISREFKKWTDVCSQTFFKKQNFCNYPSCGIILYSCFFDAIIGLFRHSITCELVLFHHVIFSRKQLSPTAPLSLRDVNGPLHSAYYFMLHVSHRTNQNNCQHLSYNNSWSLISWRI